MTSTDPVAAPTLREILARVRVDGAASGPVLVRIGGGAGPSADPTTLVLPPEGTEGLPEELGSAECVVLRPRRASRTQPARVTLGRSGDRDVVIADASVSKLHATAIVDRFSGKTLLRDEGSRNGTLVNGALVAPGELVSVGTLARVSFGTASFVFVDESTLRQLAQIA